MRPTGEKRGLELLDPATEDAAYWARFQARVLERARPALARRRRAAVLTVTEVLHSWSRTVVPMAMAATLLAALFLLEHAPGSNSPAETAGGESTVVVVNGQVEELPEFLLTGDPLNRDRALSLVEGG